MKVKHNKASPVKTALLILFLSAVFFLFGVSAFAADRVVDNAGLLSREERSSLTRMIDIIVSDYNFDIVIVTEKSIAGADSIKYADDFFDYNNYGMGPNRDGCLFLHVTDSREFWFSTSGRGIKILNESAGSKLEADVVKYLRSDRPYEAYTSFIGNWENFLILEAKGRNYNSIQRWNAILTAGAWLIALAIGFIVVSVWKKGMNTVLPKTQADAYVVPGSLTFKEQKDSFLYSTVTKVKKPKNNGSGGVHTSSSGRTHGGRGGRY